MERITFTIDDELLRIIDDLTQRRGYPSRSEAIRELVRDAASREQAVREQGSCFATLSYVYDHAIRDLPERLIGRQHDHHDLGVATTHVHVDHDTCLEVIILKGPIARVRQFADALTVQRGVRHASLHVIPVQNAGNDHVHEGGSAPHSHDSL